MGSKIERMLRASGFTPDEISEILQGSASDCDAVIDTLARIGLVAWDEASGSIGVSPKVIQMAVRGLEPMIDHMVSTLGLEDARAELSEADPAVILAISASDMLSETVNTELGERLGDEDLKLCLDAALVAAFTFMREAGDARWSRILQELNKALYSKLGVVNENL